MKLDWLFHKPRSNYFGRELPPVIMQANHRALQESRRAIAAHNEISRDFWAAGLGVRGHGEGSGPDL